MISIKSLEAKGEMIKKDLIVRKDGRCNVLVYTAGPFSVGNKFTFFTTKAFQLDENNDFDKKAKIELKVASEMIESNFNNKELKIDAANNHNEALVEILRSSCDLKGGV